MVHLRECAGRLGALLANVNRSSPRSPERSPRPGRVAQLVEHSTLNRLVAGSIPAASTNLLRKEIPLKNDAWFDRPRVAILAAFPPNIPGSCNQTANAAWSIHEPRSFGPAYLISCRGAANTTHKLCPRVVACNSDSIDRSGQQGSRWASRAPAPAPACNPEKVQPPDDTAIY